MDLRADDSLLEAGFAHEVVNRVQKPRKKSALEPTDSVEVYFSSLDDDPSVSARILQSQEWIAVGRTFAALNDYQVDGNKEMIAIGLQNMAGSCSSCYVTTGSFSRSAVNANAGLKTVVSNIIMASTVLVTLLFFMPLFHYTPNLILAAIIIIAVIELIDYRGAIRLWKVDKLDFLACLSSFFGVLMIPVPIGLAIAVGASVFKILLHVTRPNTCFTKHSRDSNLPNTGL